MKKKNTVDPRQVTDDNIIRRTRFVCWVTTATNTRSEYVMLSLFHCNNGYTTAPQYYVMRKLLVLFHHHVTALAKTQLLLWRASLITRNTAAGYDETLGFPVNMSVPFAARHDAASSSSSVICQMTGPKPLSKRFLHIVRSRASSFNRQYPLLSLTSSSSFLRLLPRLLVTSICSFIFPSITCCRRQFLRKMWPTQLAFRFLISCRIFLCSLTRSNTSSEKCVWDT